MILTITPKPAIDRTIEVPGFTAGETFEGRMVAEVYAGKGINVSRTLAAIGGRSVAAALVGKRQAAAFRASLEASGVASAFVETDGNVRVNTTIIDPGTERETHIREAGEGVSAGDVEALRTLVRAETHSGGWVAGCGSLPDGLTAEAYAGILLEGRARGARVALDASGEGLKAARLVEPDLLKPNLEELGEVCGTSIADRGDAVAAARELASEWGGAVLVTMGADGAVLVGDDYAFAMRCAADRVVSTVGAGDATLAGVLWSNVMMESPSSQLRAAVAAGAASVAEPVAGYLDRGRYDRMLRAVEVVPLPA